MTKGYFRTGKNACNFCGERDEEIRRFKHPSGDYTFICKKCAIRNSWNWEKGEAVKVQGAPPAPPPSFCYLHKIQSIKKQLEIFDILQAIRPTHAERLWISGFLKYVGYSYKETIKIIDEHCEWSDYDQDFTAYQVAKVYKQPYRTGNNTGKRRARKWDLLPTEAYRIKLVRSAESHRELEKWMRENDMPVYDAAPELEFDPALLGGLEK